MVCWSKWQEPCPVSLHMKFRAILSTTWWGNGIWLLPKQQTDQFVKITCTTTKVLLVLWPCFSTKSSKTSWQHPYIFLLPLNPASRFSFMYCIYTLHYSFKFLNPAFFYTLDMQYLLTNIDFRSQGALLVFSNGDHTNTIFHLHLFWEFYNIYSCFDILFYTFTCSLSIFALGIYLQTNEAKECKNITSGV